MSPDPINVYLPYLRKRVTEQDLRILAGKIAILAPEITLHGIDVENPPPWLLAPPLRKSFTFTLNVTRAAKLMADVPGPKYIARGISKPKQLKRLEKAGVRVPATAPFSEALAPDPDRFSPYIFVKTTAPGSSRARGIVFLRTEEFPARAAEIAAQFAEDIAAGHIPLVQAHVPTGLHPTHVRVLTFFGHPLMVYRTTAPAPFDPEKLADTAEGAATSNASDRRDRRLEDDPEITAFGAHAAAAAFPETPVMGMDILRHVETGELYCIEANVGNTAPLSAPVTGSLRDDLGTEAMLAQFSAYDVIAEEVVRRARAEAHGRVV